MALTSIGSQKTPGRPVEITFAGITGLPSADQTVLLIGHAASGATGTNTVVTINNVADIVAGTAEANTKFGTGSEAAKMVIAAINANAGGSTFPALKVCPLASTDVTIAAAAQAAILKCPNPSFLVSCYDGSTDSADRTIMKTLATTLSGAQRVQNNQFGTFAVIANQSVTDPSTLTPIDSQFVVAVWKRDSAPVYTVGELAAAAAAVMASNAIPFNPLDDVTVFGVLAPTAQTDWPSVGAGLESETCLGKGWTPLYVKASGDVAFVRTVTSRLSADGTGTPVLTAYYDVQDFQVLYFWRKTLFTRFSQPDLKQAKASVNAARLVRGEAIRLAQEFQDQNMFQAVTKLAPQFDVQRNASDRHRFDVFTPVNVIPGLHVIATNVQATTQFDVISV